MTRSAVIALPLFLFVVNTYAQRVFYTSEAVNQPGTGQAIRNVRANWTFSPKITVLYEDGHKEKVARNTIWGYEDRKKRVFRYYGKSFYQLVDAGDLIKYRHPQVGANGMPTEYTYFSKTLDSDIRGMKRKAQKGVFDTK